MIFYFLSSGLGFMQTKAKHSLQRTMIIYFLLIGFASLLVGVEFIVDTHGQELKDELVLKKEHDY